MKHIILILLSILVFSSCADEVCCIEFNNQNALAADGKEWRIEGSWEIINGDFALPNYTIEVVPPSNCSTLTDDINLTLSLYWEEKGQIYCIDDEQGEVTNRNLTMSLASPIASKLFNGGLYVSPKSQNRKWLWENLCSEDGSFLVMLTMEDCYFSETYISRTLGVADCIFPEIVHHSAFIPTGGKIPHYLCTGKNEIETIQALSNPIARYLSE